jgi:hypothetical protein
MEQDITPARHPEYLAFTCFWRSGCSRYRELRIGLGADLVALWAVSQEKFSDSVGLRNIIINQKLHC